jgi:hypothetical protein
MRLEISIAIIECLLDSVEQRKTLDGTESPHGATKSIKLRFVSEDLTMKAATRLRRFGSAFIAGRLMIFMPAF